MTSTEVLRRFNEESLPEFCDPLTDVNQIGTFGNRPLHIASYRGDTDAVAALVTAGADVNAVGDMGSTPLHEAVEQQHEPTVKFLLDNGADKTMKNDFGKTPLDLANEKGLYNIIGLLNR